jgi:membrane protease YdiL (CAAX protease family)
MFSNLSSRTKAVTYAVLVLVLSFTVAFAMRSQGEAAAVVVMLTPTVAVLLMQLVVTRDGRTRDGWRILGLRHAGFRFWPIAIAMPVAVLAGAEAVVALTGLTGTDLSAFPNVPDLAIQLVIVGLFSLAEEIGWRGYLLPLVEQGWPGSRTLAAARVGFLHGLWHLPVALVVSGAYLTDGPRWLTVPLFLAVLTTAGVLYGWLRDRSGSVWPAAVTHTVFNVTLGIIFNVFPSDDLDTVVLVGRETGIATLGLLVLAAAFLTTRRTPAPLAAEPAPVVLAGR